MRRRQLVVCRSRNRRNERLETFRFLLDCYVCLKKSLRYHQIITLVVSLAMNSKEIFIKEDISYTVQE